MHKTEDGVTIIRCSPDRHLKLQCTVRNFHLNSPTFLAAIQKKMTKVSVSGWLKFNGVFNTN